jgi:spore coat polysaccharide biosynthesis protein SpsF (cytidylyltransferase family)
MTTACIIQARLGSTRLPAKVLLPLPTGRTVLEEVVYRCRQIKGVDVVVVAVADDAGSDIVADHAMKARFAPRELGPELTPMLVTRGPEHDALKRYVMAAEEVKADIIMRVTADCPLIDPEVCAEVLIQLKNDGLDYCSNVHPRTFPKGFDIECFTMETLKRVDQLATSDGCREHVTLYVYTTEGFKRGNYQQNVDRSHIRLTLDTLEDYKTIWNEFETSRAGQINERYIEAINASR